MLVVCRVVNIVFGVPSSFAVWRAAAGGKQLAQQLTRRAAVCHIRNTS
jgi:hypothetical protein